MKGCDPWWWLAGLLALAGPVLGQGPTGARIVEVLYEKVGPPVAGGMRLVPNRLAGFPAAPAVTPAERFFVIWDPIGPETPAGVRVVFEYRKAAGPARALQVAYPFPVTERREAVFEFPLTPERGGPVTQWRARVMLRDRVLAQSASCAWR